MSRPLEISSFKLETNSMTLHFYAVAGQSYTLEYSNGPLPGGWQTRRHLPALPANGDYTITDDGFSGSTCFYRLTVP